MQERLQKILARAGFASRRGAEQLMSEGRVTLNGALASEPGTKADLDRDDVRVDGVRVKAPLRPVYLVLNKPRGVVATRRDPQGRQTVMDLVPPSRGLFPVGRLDVTTEGLILLTNDGELAHRLMHPSYEVPKTYVATVNGAVPRGLGKQLRAGVDLEDGPVVVDDFAVVDSVPGKTMVRVTLHEGRKRIVRRLLAAVGYPVQSLVRTDIGAVSLGNQRPGSIRPLRRDEIGELYKAVGL